MHATYVQGNAYRKYCAHVVCISINIDITDKRNEKKRKLQIQSNEIRWRCLSFASSSVLHLFLCFHLFFHFPCVNGFCLILFSSHLWVHQHMLHKKLIKFKMMKFNYAFKNKPFRLSAATFCLDYCVKGI